MKKFKLLFYYLIISKLPNSAFPLGKYFNKLRISCLKGIIQIGDSCKVQKNVYIGNGDGIRIGNNCQINDNIRFDNIRIGNSVMIARDCIFLGKMHQYENLDVPMIDQGAIEVEQTVIDDDVWIGARAIVMPGIYLAKGTIIGAGAVVTKNTIVNGIYAGVPAKFIKTRE